MTSMSLSPMEYIFHLQRRASSGNTGMEGLKLRSTSMPAPRACAYAGTGRSAYVLNKEDAILVLSFFTGV